LWLGICLSLVSNILTRYKNEHNTSFHHFFL
jgi:hypothetical protein